jgi:hypothetical protein
MEKAMFINWDDALHFDPHNPTDAFATHGIPVPTYGNYGGPGYTARTLGGTTPETPDPAPVDTLDALFYQHDLVYQHFRDGTATLQDTIAADVQGIKSAAALTYTDPGDPNYNPEAGLYEGLAVIGLFGKLAGSGVLQHLSPLDQLAIAAATKEAFVNFNAALDEIPSEARGLHGALHIIEHQFAGLLNI